MFSIYRLSRDSPLVGEWMKMRLELWPDAGEDEAGWVLERFAVFVAVADTAVGFAEAGLREYAEGCETSPVGYLEGWYVRREWRRRGVGRALVEAVENWAREQGAAELASDTQIWNHGSELAHRALGFEETDRIVCFRKDLKSTAP